MYTFVIIALLALATVKLVDMLCDYVAVLRPMRSLLTFVVAIGGVWALDFSMFEGWNTAIRDRDVGDRRHRSRGRRRHRGLAGDLRLPDPRQGDGRRDPGRRAHHAAPRRLTHFRPVPAREPPTTPALTTKPGASSAEGARFAPGPLARLDVRAMTATERPGEPTIVAVDRIPSIHQRLSVTWPRATVTTVAGSEQRTPVCSG